jgi:formyl-CoA transferase
MASGPLSGIRVLDLTQVIAGPLGCMLLSDLGAEVIKVEPPEGEPWRLTSQFFPNESKAYQALNRGKQSLVLDLSRPECQEVVHRLVRTCDVTVINSRPDVAARLGVDYETLKQHRPDLVYVDSTAFGRKGPWAHRPGYDIVAQAASGLLMHRLWLDEHGFPALSGPAAPADFTTAYSIALAVCAALLHRNVTGRGQLVETSLLANALMIQGSAFMSVPVADGERRAAFLGDLERSRAEGEPFDTFVRRRRAASETVIGMGIYYRGYKTKDGALTVGCLSPSTRERMRAALQIEDPLEGSNAKAAPREAIDRIEAMFEQRTTDEWMAIFDTHGVPASPVWFVEELLDNPQVVENGYVVDLEHDLTGSQTMAAPPWRMSDSPPQAQGAAPPLGRDTRRWLIELGYGEEDIRVMADSGAIGLGFGE